MNNVIKCKVVNDPLESFIQSEAEALNLPEDFIRSAVYTTKHGAITYFGQGYLAILSLIASNLELGVMEFGDFKFRFFDTKYILDNQIKWKDLIFKRDSEKIAAQGAAWVANLNNFHILNANQIVATTATADALEEAMREDHSIYIPKDLPVIKSCHVDWKILRGDNIWKAGESCYSVDYSKTTLGVLDKQGKRTGAANYLIGTMITRTKIAAHNHAFGNSSQYLIKLCKVKHHYDQNDDLIDELIIDRMHPHGHHTEISAEHKFLEEKRAILQKDELSKEELCTEIKNLTIS